MNTEAEVWARIRKLGPDACWPWLGARTARGYGNVQYNGKWLYAHRLVYTWAVGAIPPGMDVCHTCDNPPCCNPAHLFLGTRMQNMADAVRKGRVANGERLPQSKLSEKSVVLARRAYRVGMTIEEIAALCRMSEQAIRRAVLKESWRHVTDEKGTQQ